MPKSTRTQFFDEENNFIGNLSAYMKDHNKSPQDIADMLSLSPVTINSWLAGRVSPTLKDIRKFMAMANMDVNSVFNENGNSHVNMYSYDAILKIIEDYQDAMNISSATVSAHADTRINNIAHTVAVKNSNPNLDIYGALNATFFVDFSASNLQYKKNVWQLVLITRPKDSEPAFRWMYTSDIPSIGKVARVYIGDHRTDHFTKENTESMRNIEDRYIRHGLVKQIVVSFTDHPVNRKEGTVTPYFAYKQNLSVNVSSLIKKYGMTQYTDFAKPLYVSSTEIRNIVLNDYVPDDELFKRIEETYHATKSELLFDEGRAFVDLFKADELYEGFKKGTIRKKNRLTSIPVNPKIIDSSYCFAVTNTNKDLLLAENSTVQNNCYFIVDSYYTTSAFSATPTLECLLDHHKNEAVIKWVYQIKDQVFVGDSPDNEKAKVYFDQGFAAKYERAGRVVEAEVYNKGIVKEGK